MEVCRTDIKRIIGLLDVGAGIIKSYGRNPREQDKARLMRLMCKKLKKKMTSQAKTSGAFGNKEVRYNKHNIKSRIQALVLMRDILASLLQSLRVASPNS